MSRVGFANPDNMQVLLEGLFSFVNFATNNARKPNEIQNEVVETKPIKTDPDMTAPIDDNLLLSLQTEMKPSNNPQENLIKTEVSDSENRIGSNEIQPSDDKAHSESEEKDSDGTPSKEEDEASSEMSEEKEVLKKGRKKSGKNKNSNTNREWGESDDKLLRNLVIQYKNDWKKISRRILSLTGLRRSASHLKNYFKEIKESCPQKQVRFTDAEDKILTDLIRTHGMKWSIIAKEFPGRDPISLKNRYYSHIRKKEQPPKEAEPPQIPVEVKNKVPEKPLIPIKEPTNIDILNIDSRPKLTLTPENLASLNLALNAQALLGRDHLANYYPFFNHLAFKAFENTWFLGANAFQAPFDQTKLNLHK